MGMKQFTLVYDHLGTIHSDLELPLYLEYINVEPYQSDKTYNPKTTLYYTDSLKKTQLHDVFLDQGFRIVYDNLHEPGSNLIVDRGHVMHNQNYMWYHDSLQMIGHGHDKYQPNKTYQKLALMPMHLAKVHRTQILEKTVAYLDDFYWSYVAHGRQLPDDVPWDFSAQRHFNPAWYDDTCISLVAESRVSRKPTEMLLITEKTFKPIAFRHPFLLWGEMGSLSRLKTLGFETFDNLFDESYDDISNHTQRLDAVVNNIATFNKVPYDTVTMQKLQHNHARFFDRALIEQRIKKEIIEPLLAYAESSQ
jgi:hypothetical protein